MGNWLQKWFARVFAIFLLPVFQKSDIFGVARVNYGSALRSSPFVFLRRKLHCVTLNLMQNMHFRHFTNNSHCIQMSTPTTVIVDFKHSNALQEMYMMCLVQMKL